MVSWMRWRATDSATADCFALEHLRAVFAMGQVRGLLPYSTILLILRNNTPSVEVNVGSTFN